MKTLSNPVSPRAILVSALALVMVGGLSQMPLLKPKGVAFVPRTTEHAPIRPAPSSKALPFSSQDVVEFLGDNFHAQPVESGPGYAKFIHSERQPDGTEIEVMRIAVRSREEYLQVAFSFREFSAMHYVAEFIEAPLFERTETEQLYALLYASNSQPNWKQVGRFQAKVTFSKNTEEMGATFEFASRVP